MATRKQNQRASAVETDTGELLQPTNNADNTTTDLDREDRAHEPGRGERKRVRAVADAFAEEVDEDGLDEELARWRALQAEDVRFIRSDVDSRLAAAYDKQHGRN